MNITCVHCGQTFSIAAEQLGTRGKCPHCLAIIALPKSESTSFGHTIRTKPRSWTETSLSGIASIALHIVILSLLLLIPWNRTEHVSPQEGTPVEIWVAQAETLVNTPHQWDLSAIEQGRFAAFELASAELLAPLKIADSSAAQIASPYESALDGSLDTEAFGNLRSPQPADETGQDFGQLIQKLNRDGLDIVITFDSTGSMDAEIRQVKSKIERIGEALLKLVPKTRISICTYRDEGDDYVVQGLKLTDNLAKVADYLDAISAKGGGDTPEAVDQALHWAIHQNQFRPSARKVVLLFGDAPPHAERKKTCVGLAADFRHQQNGTVSTVTCHGDDRLPDFVEIALAGGGESFLSPNDQEIMTQLMILVFGSQHQQKVIEALNLLR